MNDNEKFGYINFKICDLYDMINPNPPPIDRSTWKEELLNNEYQEEELLNNEYQEEEYNDEDYSNFIEERSCSEAIVNLMNGSFCSKVSIKIDSTSINDDITVKSFVVISKDIDVINNFYLEIDLGNNFEEISIEEKYSILNSEIEITIGYTTINKLKLITCIINQICSGNNIKENDNIIQIPLYNFDTCIDKKYNIKGFPVIALKYDRMVIKLRINNKIHTALNYKLIINGLIFKNENRKDLALNSHESILLQDRYVYDLISNDNKYKLYFTDLVKYIMIYFMPMSNKDIDFWTINENYPLINKITLYMNNKEVLVFENEDLLDFEIFGIKVYMLPLCKEFSDFENIYETFKNPLKLLSSSGINFSYSYKDATYINVDIENKSDMYYINYIGVKINSIIIQNGLCRLQYYEKWN